MGKEDIAFNKMALLMEAIQEVNRRDEAMDELRAAAFEVLLLHPGSDYRSWSDILYEQYTMEVYDAFGEDENVIRPGIAKLWQEEYKDIASGLEYTYSEWAKVFATSEAVQMYYDMIEKLKNVNAM